jgi:hypothetical protein
MCHNAGPAQQPIFVPSSISRRDEAARPPASPPPLA